jgi:hypothetical protein
MFQEHHTKMLAFLLSDDFSGSDDVNISSDIIFEATFDQNGEQLNSLTTSGEQLKDLAKSVAQVKGIVTSGNQVQSTLTSAQPGPGKSLILSMFEIFTLQLLQLYESLKWQPSYFGNNSY